MPEYLLYSGKGSLTVVSLDSNPARCRATIAINQPRTSYFVGGSEVVSLEHAKSLLRLGYTVLFYTINPASIGTQYSHLFSAFKAEYGNHPALYLRELQQDSRALEVYSTIPGEDKDRWYMEAMFYNRPLFEALLQETGSIDVLFSYYQFDALTVPSSRIGQNVLYMSGIPSSENNLRASQLRMYDQLFAITEGVREYWQRYDKRPIIVVPTGVELPTRVERQPNSSAYSIVFAGRLIERKGCASLLEAIALLPESLRLITRVTILGDGPQREALEQLIHTKGLSDQVELRGVVNNPSDFFASSDLCVFPSLRGEGLMGVVLEAMATGACVVSTYGNGNEELLAQERGLLFEGGDVKALSVILTNLLSDQEARLRLGKAAREYVELQYNWDKQTEALFGTIVPYDCRSA